MFLYWVLYLFMIIPLAGIAALLRRILRPYVSTRTLTLWGSLCLANGLFCLVLYHLTNGTVYARGYSETRFKQVVIGMSYAQVRALVGEPLAQWYPYQYTNYVAKRHYVGYVYSRDEDSYYSVGDYEIRQINFDRGRVAEIVSHRWYD